MDNYQVVEKLTNSFVNFLDTIKISKKAKDEWSILKLLDTSMKISFIKAFVLPYKDNIDTLVDNLLIRYNDKKEHHKKEDIETLKNYFNCYIECLS